MKLGEKISTLKALWIAKTAVIDRFIPQFCLPDLMKLFLGSKKYIID